jgi:cyclopropane fatty-acyl-phospholipid synthase-like methyltransferase
LKINSRGYWENETQEGHGVDESIAKAIKIFLQTEIARLWKTPISVVDIGCGNGYYTQVLNSDGVTCLGFDGNPYTEFISNRFCSVADFSVKQELGLYDWVLSLEVGEHIPEEYEDIFIDNLHRHNRYGMIISWSIPEYGGDGHFNPKPNSYIIDKITKLGYTLDKTYTDIIRNKANNCYWFRETLFVFRKDE